MLLHSRSPAQKAIRDNAQLLHNGLAEWDQKHRDALASLARTRTFPSNLARTSSSGRLKGLLSQVALAQTMPDATQLKLAQLTAFTAGTRALPTQ